MTASALAQRTRWPEWMVEGLLEQEIRRGSVERVNGGFRLTPRMERRYGQTLRNFWPDTDTE